MKKALVVAHVASMIDLFNRGNISLLQKKGFKVDIACNFDNGNVTSFERLQDFKNELRLMNIEMHNIPFPRKIVSIHGIWESYKLLKNLLNDNKYDLIHCQSPIASVITRLACKNVNSNIKMLYMAHGFHFYRGASIFNWILFYNIEKYCSKFTDTLVTINEEDYNLAIKKFKNIRSIQYIPGVGVNIEKINSIKVSRIEKLEELGIPSDSIIFVSVGELNKNKNHKVVIKALAQLKNNNIYYIICGIGPQYPELRKLVNKYNLSKNVKMLEFREDIIELLKVSDAFIFPSKREGLSLSLMEAMAAGLPILCSNIRGNVDLIKQGEGGYLFGYNDVNSISKYMIQIYSNAELRRRMGIINEINIKEKDIKVINKLMNNIYDLLDEN